MTDLYSSKHPTIVELIAIIWLSGVLEKNPHRWN